MNTHMTHSIIVVRAELPPIFYYNTRSPDIYVRIEEREPFTLESSGTVQYILCHPTLVPHHCDTKSSVCLRFIFGRSTATCPAENKQCRQTRIMPCFETYR